MHFSIKSISGLENGVEHISLRSSFRYW